MTTKKNGAWSKGFWAMSGAQHKSHYWIGVHAHRAACGAKKTSYFYGDPATPANPCATCGRFLQRRERKTA